MQVLRDPDATAALRFFQAELQGLANRAGHLVQAVGECEVHYQGRARSLLNRGERLLLLKPDGTFLVHTAEKAKPVNWQPPGAAFAVALDADGRVVLTSHRAKPEELVRVTFHSLRLLVAIPLHDRAELALLGSEDDLQKLLFDHPELVEAGFVAARRERDTTRGYYDLDGHDAQGRRLYVEELRGGDPKVRGLLIAPKVAPKARALLRDQALDWKELDWDEVLPKVEAMRRGGQASLVHFG